jgi:hypothetical protein
MVVFAVLWGKSSRAGHCAGDERKRVSRPLCWAALLWIVSITGLLVFMTFVTISRLAAIGTLVGTALVILFAFVYYRLQRKTTPAVAIEPAQQD